MDKTQKNLAGIRSITMIGLVSRHAVPAFPFSTNFADATVVETPEERGRSRLTLSLSAYRESEMPFPG